MTEITRKYPRDADEMLQKVKIACSKLRFRIVKEDVTTRRIQVSTEPSAFSWGEKMEVLVSQQKNGSTVTAKSSPTVWFNLTARGRADRNAKDFFDELERAS